MILEEAMKEIFTPPTLDKPTPTFVDPLFPSSTTSIVQEIVMIGGKANSTLPPLTKEMMETINSFVAHKDSSFAIIDNYMCRITVQDLLTLNKNEWLNDEVNIPLICSFASYFLMHPWF